MSSAKADEIQGFADRNYKAFDTAEKVPGRSCASFGCPDSLSAIIRQFHEDMTARFLSLTLQTWQNQRILFPYPMASMKAAYLLRHCSACCFRTCLPIHSEIVMPASRSGAGLKGNCSTPGVKVKQGNCYPNSLRGRLRPQRQH